MTPIPIVLITGYLGAGKTTLINHLLSLPEVAENKLALVINEFGALGVDGKLVRPGKYAKFEINHGSLFCICTLSDLVKALGTIAREVRPDRVLIEVTGVAETRDFEGLLGEPGLFGQLKLQANVCVVDALNFTKVAGFLAPASRQVEWADGIILNKADLVDESDLGKLGAVLKRINPDAQQVAARHGAIPFSFLENLTHARRPGGMAASPPAQVVAVSLQTDRVLDRTRFTGLLKSLGTKILRLKGNIDFGKGPRFVEVVYNRFSEKPACDALGSMTAFTVIASQISVDDLRSIFESTWRVE
jgi:G3E family GTPase